VGEEYRVWLTKFTKIGFRNSDASFLN
jgi:hypothetical protein